MSYVRPIGAIRIIGAAIVSAAFLFASAPSAFATADPGLVASSPQADAEVRQAPSQVELLFSQPLLPVGNRVIVLGPDGRSYQTGPAQLDNKLYNKLTQQLAPLGPSGEYRVDFLAMRSDGHALNETIAFTLNKPGPAAGATVPPGPHQFTQVGETALTNAPSWAPWAVGAAALIALSGAVLFGRRVTHDLG